MFKTIRFPRASVVVLGGLLLPALASSAKATGIPLGNGQSRLELSRGLDRGLRQADVAITALGSAKLKGRELTMPVISGSFLPGTENAILVQGGGFKFEGGKSDVAVRDLRFDSSRKGLTAEVAGKRIELAKLINAEISEEGFVTRLEARRVALTAKGAAVLNRTLRLPKLLRSGRTLSSVEATAEPVHIWFGSLGIGGPATTTFTRLESIGAGFSLWGAMSFWKAPGETYFSFDVKPTVIAPDGSTGIIEGAENDGVEIQLYNSSPPRFVLLRHPRIDLERAELTATLSPPSMEAPMTGAIATLDFRTANFNFRPKVGSYELRDIRAVATQFIADQLTQSFATPGMFQAGETLALVHAVLSD